MGDSSSHRIPRDLDLVASILASARANGGEFADLFAEQREFTSLSLEDGKLEKVSAGSDAGAGIRVISTGRTSHAVTTGLDSKSLREAAASAAAASSAPARPVAALSPYISPLAFQCLRPPHDVEVSEKIALLRAADRIARSVSSSVLQVSAGYRDVVQHVVVANSSGVFAEDERIYTTCTIHVVASGNGIVQTAYESVGGNAGFEILSLELVEQLAEKTARRAVRMLSAPQAPSGRMPVVISSLSGGTMIHEAIGHGLEADLSGQGLSVFAGKLGKQVASPLVTVVDDATLPSRRGSFRIDDEGTPSQRTVLVENGMLVSYMYDRLTAMKEQRESTGNGRRESFRHRPIPRMTNTFIAPGASDPDGILQSVEHGLYVEKIGGGQVNTVTGDFVFDVQEACLIEKGQRGEPVRGATLSGNGPRVLKEIDMVGNDLGFSIGTCGKDAQGVPVSDAMPTVRIPELVVGGIHS